VAPEVIQLEGASSNSDIWSMGCTVIEMISGAPPYAELNPLTVLYSIVKDEHPPFPSTLSSELEQFLVLCFQRDPSKRPSARQLLTHPWICKFCGDLSAELKSGSAGEFVTNGS
jgi:serine/threonine protein kinase